ncbi:MAG: TolC family outer membrane protein [Pseudomonadota bacterium]
MSGIPKRTFASALLRFSVVGIAASAANMAWSMDLMEAYQAALTQDATIRVSRATADAGRERVPQARAQLLPNLSASFSRNKNDLTQTVPDLTGNPFTTKDQYFSHNKTVQLRQPLFRKAVYDQYKQALVLQEDVEATLDRDLQQLNGRLSTAYLNALLAQDQLDLIAGQKQAYIVQLDAAKKSLQAGSGTRTDIDDAQAKLDLIVAQELEASQNQDVTRRQLEAIVNQPVLPLAKLDVNKLQLLPPVPARVDEWLALAEQYSPELRSLRAQRDAAEYAVKIAEDGHLPTLDAIAQYSDSGSENVVNFRARYQTTSIGLQLSVPLYSGGAVNSQVRQALAQQEAATEQYEVVRRDLGVRVHNAYRGVNEGILKIRALEQGVRSAEQAVQSSEKSYAAGVRTRLDILNTQAQRLAALRDLAQARYSYIAARISLQALAGGDKEAPIMEANSWLTATPAQ